MEAEVEQGGDMRMHGARDLPFPADPTSWGWIWNLIFGLVYNPETRPRPCLTIAHKVKDTTIGRALKI